MRNIPAGMTTGTVESIGQYTYLASDGKIYVGNSYVAKEGEEYNGYYKRCEVPNTDGSELYSASPKTSLLSDCEQVGSWIKVPLSNLNNSKLIDSKVRPVQALKTYGAYVVKDASGENILTQSVLNEDGTEGFYRMCTISDAGGFGDKNKIGPGDCGDDAWNGPITY